MGGAIYPLRHIPSSITQGQCIDVRAETHINVSRFGRTLTQTGTCQHILDNVPCYEIFQKSLLNSMWLISCRLTFFKVFAANTQTSRVEVR